MNLDAINLVIRYYQAVWHYFDPEMLEIVFDPHITTFHTRRGEKCSGIKEVIETYKTHFFETVDLKSTKIYNFSIQQGMGIIQDQEQVVVSYTLEQTHSDRGKTFGHVTETFELKNDLITHITMRSDFMITPPPVIRSIFKTGTQLPELY